MKPKAPSGEMRPEYEFDYSKAVRGKYYERIMREGTHIVKLDPDVARAFRTDRAVNEALRRVLRERKPAARTSSRAARVKRG